MGSKQEGNKGRHEGGREVARKGNTIMKREREECNAQMETYQEGNTLGKELMGIAN